MNTTFISKASIEKESNNMIAARIPGIIWIFVTYIICMVVQFLSHPSFYSHVIFTFLMILFGVVYWYSNLFLPKKYWLYFILQASLVYISAFMMENFPGVVITLYPLLVGQIIGILGRKKVYLFLIIFTLFTINTFVIVPLHDLPIFLIIALPAMIVIIAYAVIFFNQVNARIRLQRVLEEVELANQEVERLTLHNERQRIARDLHDTLAQGLAGLKIQLEAINIHLSKGNDVLAKEIVNQSMKGVSETLADARLAIDDLRLHSNEKYDFKQNIVEQLNHIKLSTGLACHFDFYVIQHELSNTVTEQSLPIISECLLNIARHAQANNLWLSVKKDNEENLNICIRDDGIGFDPDLKIGQEGHYGLVGLNERVRILGGKIQIKSIQNKGTKIFVQIPCQGAD
ncbi:sensor histidine kinase [Bacillus zhangzhouensis]|nr:sensor histidine kinase [Bacillus zhangzhouensis]